MSLGPLSFAAPHWLLLLPLALYLFLAWRRFGVQSGSFPVRRFVPVLRAGALTALILILAQAQWLAKVPGVDIHVLIDRSASVGTDAHLQAEELLQALHAVLGPHDRIATYAFGRESFAERPLGPAAAASAASRTAPDPTATNLEAALLRAVDALDPGANSRILIVSDGIETVGDAASLLPLLQEIGVPVDVFPVGASVETEVAIEHVLAPSRVAAGEPYAVRAVVSATAPTPASVALYREGELISQQSLHLEAGRNVITFAGLIETEETTGSVRFELHVRAEHDVFPENNVGYAVLESQGSAAILVITEEVEAAHALRALLADQRLQVEIAPVDAAPGDPRQLAPYQAVILHNLPAYQLSRRQMDALVHYVEQIGGGLLVVGGERSFGLGGYQNTPLETILPVSMDAPQNVIMPTLALVLVLDRSGSMAETQGAFSKLDLAKEASLGVLDVAQDHDLLGVIAFDSAPRWVVPLQPVENRFAFAGPIASISPEGGTNMGPALEEAHHALAAVDASVKHVLVLTDGISAPADFEGIALAMRADGITTSTVGIGRDADRELLAQLAAWGGGRYYYTDNIHTVPQIFATETLLVTRPIRFDEPFVPQWHQRADFWSATEPLPPLGGYVITTAKAAAAVHLRGPDESPVLATWRFGLGRTAAFTSSLTGPWAEAWHSWPLAGAFWGQLVRWLMRAAPGEGLIPQLLLDGTRGHLSVDAFDEGGRYLNFLDLEAVVWTPAGEVLHLEPVQTSPGRYTAEFPATAQGIYLATVQERGTAEGQAVTVGAVLPYPEEYRILRPETGLLYRLALGTGGAILHEPTPAALAPLLDHPHPTRRARPFAPQLFALAFFAFLGDILLRYLTAERLATVREGLRRLSTLADGSSAAERRLEERMRAEKAHLEALLQRHDPSGLAETERSRRASHYLAARRKRGG